MYSNCCQYWRYYRDTNRYTTQCDRAPQYLTGENSISDFLSWWWWAYLVIIQLTIAWPLLQNSSLLKKEIWSSSLMVNLEKVGERLSFTSPSLPLSLVVDDHQTARHMNTYVVSINSAGGVHSDRHHGKEELKLINWDVLWLVAGGIAIGIGLDKTGLAAALAHAIDYESLPPLAAVVLTLSIVCWLMANFMSNTATANLLMPIAAAIGASMESLVAIGGLQGLLVVVAFSASLGMILPVSTPPNSLAYSTDLSKAKTWRRWHHLRYCRLVNGLLALFIITNRRSNNDHFYSTKALNVNLAPISAISRTMTTTSDWNLTQ